jgi:PAS domain S-box-containing protein
LPVGLIETDIYVRSPLPISYLMSRIQYFRLLTYGVAILSVIAALVLTLLIPQLFTPNTFQLFYAAVVISAWYGGMVAGIVAIALSIMTNLVLLTSFGFLPLSNDLWIELLGFTLVSVLISSLCSRLWISERRAAVNLRSLQESESRFNRLAETNILGIITATMDGKILEANPAFLQMTGYTQADLCGGRIRWAEMTPPKYQTVEAQAIAELKTTGKCTPFEKEYIRKDGSSIPVIVGGALHGSDPQQWIGFVLDISERKQAEQERSHLLIHEQAARAEAEANKEQISKILESITDGFVAFDLSWRFAYINREAARMLHRKPEELLGKNLWQEFPGVEHTQFGHLARKVMIEKNQAEAEEYLPLIHAWFAVRIYSSDAGVAVYFHDVTERKQAEVTIDALNRGLRRRANELQTLFNVIPIGISIAEDPACQHVRVNPAFAQILGVPLTANASYTPPSNQSLPLHKFYRNGKELKGQELPLQYAAANGRELRDLEIDVVAANGDRYNLYGHAAPLFDEQGKPRGAVAAFLDITGRKRAEEERAQSLEREKQARQQAEVMNRMKDEFLATLSHELRSPLNAMLGWAQMLKMRKLSSEQQSQAVEIIERNARSQAQLIEDLLDVSRIITGKLRLTIQTIDLIPILEAAIDTVRPAAAAKNITLQFEPQRHHAPISGDSDRLQQVFWNLLSNAIKFTPMGGRVEIKLMQGMRAASEAAKTPADATVTGEVSAISASLIPNSGDYVWVQVIDNGCGIKPETLPYIFERFRQADSSTTRSYGGLGLGLAIVRHLVELHGGTVHADSNGEGQGATFTVQLPLTVTRHETATKAEWALSATSPQPSAEVANQLDGVRVLVVDDEVDAREVLRVILEQYGAQVAIAASVMEAIELIQQSPPDVLISDIGMPGEDGYSLIRQVQALAQKGIDVPAAALTAYARTEDERQALAAGFQTHVAKPVEPTELVEVVLALLDGKE